MREHQAALAARVGELRHLLDDEKLWVAALESSIADCICESSLLLNNLCLRNLGLLLTSPYWCGIAAEEQFYEMRRRLGLIWKETDHYRSIATADLVESRDLHGLLSKDHGVAESNRNNTRDLRTRVQKERLAEDDLRRLI